MLGSKVGSSILAIIVIVVIGLCAAPGVQADTAPDDPYLPVVNSTTNPASAEFVNEVRVYVSLVPSSVKIPMRDVGEQIRIARHASDILPGAPDNFPAVFTCLDSVPAPICVHPTILLAEFAVVDGGIEERISPDGAAQHEMGHGLDWAEGVLQFGIAQWGYSGSPGFTAAYTKDLTEMPPAVQTQFANLIQGGTPDNPSPQGKAETFAAAFALRYAPLFFADLPGNDAFRQYFDDTVAWVNGVLPAPLPLSATTGAATDVTDLGASLHGSVNPFGIVTTYRFDYGTTISYGSSTPAYGAGSGTGDVPVAADPSALAPNTTYHYRIVEMRYGVPVFYGADAQFTTLAHTAPPLNVSPPAIRGTPAPGVTLVCDPGQWDFFDSWSYAWLRDGVAVTGDSPYGGGYLVQPGDVGHQVACRVTATNSYGSSSATSAPVMIRASAPVGITPSNGGTTPSGGGTTLGVKATAPRLTQLRLSPARFRAAKSGPSTLAKGRSGTLVSFTIDKAATVTFTIERSQPGRLDKGSCRAQTPSNRTAKRCTRWILVKGSFTWAARAGANSLRFSGRIGVRWLAAANYRLIAIPRDRSGTTGQVIRATFTIRP